MSFAMVPGWGFWHCNCRRGGERDGVAFLDQARVRGGEPKWKVILPTQGGRNRTGMLMLGLNNWAKREREKKNTFCPLPQRRATLGFFWSETCRFSLFLSFLLISCVFSSFCFSAQEKVTFVFSLFRGGRKGRDPGDPVCHSGGVVTGTQLGALLLVSWYTHSLTHTHTTWIYLVEA